MPADELARLIRLLQNAYSGELAAGYAYRGHWHSVRNPEERKRIQEIENDEWHHRQLVGDMIRDLGASPRRIREIVMLLIGRGIGLLCRIGGWFGPMYGAGRLEKHNIVEYEDAAAIAAKCGHHELIDCLLTMAEVEWEHEFYFRNKLVGHPLLRVFPLWEAPPAKETILREERSVRSSQFAVLSSQLSRD